MAEVKLIANNPEFEPFIVTHFDKPDDSDDLRRIEHLAITKCPAGAVALCPKLKVLIKSLGAQL